jgi:hypothetical protein
MGGGREASKHTPSGPESGRRLHTSKQFSPQAEESAPNAKGFSHLARLQLLPHLECWACSRRHRPKRDRTEPKDDKRTPTSCAKAAPAPLLRQSRCTALGRYDCRNRLRRGSEGGYAGQHVYKSTHKRITLSITCDLIELDLKQQVLLSHNLVKVRRESVGARHILSLASLPYCSLPYCFGSYRSGASPSGPTRVPDEQTAVSGFHIHPWQRPNCTFHPESLLRFGVGILAARPKVLRPMHDGFLLVALLAFCRFQRPRSGFRLISHIPFVYIYLFVCMYDTFNVDICHAYDQLNTLSLISTLSVP